MWTPVSLAERTVVDDAASLGLSTRRLAWTERTGRSLLGDQYLARVYRIVSQRFHLEAWDASILRKLQTLESIYGKMSDRAGTRRMEVLEWIIIILIALSLAVSLFPVGKH